MTEPGYTTTIRVAATPDDVFAAVNDVRAWWSHDIEGPTDTVGAEFTFRGKDVHRSRIRVTDLVPAERVAWHVRETYLSFVEDQTEWEDTRIVFDIEEMTEGTQVRFTHVGLVPAYECYDVCSNAWQFFIHDSLRSLVETGTGMPMPKTRVARSA